MNPFRVTGRGQNSEAPTSSSDKKRGQKSKDKSQTEAGEKEMSTTTNTNRSKNKVDDSVLPDKMKKQRACMICCLIKTQQQFEVDGCDNCESFLGVAGTKGYVYGYTSKNFEGMIGMINPEESWVAKWQGLGTLKPGMYAVTVRGEVANWVKEEMSHAGLTYYCRAAIRQEKH